MTHFFRVSSVVARISCCALLSGFASAALAAGTDEQWEITTKMEMAGMPMALPSQTNKVCLPKNRNSDEGLIPQDKNSDCKMDDMKRSGNKTTFKMSCAGKHPMTGNGEIENNGDSYRGTMHIVGKMEGEDVDMKQSFSGKRIGSCTYEDQGKKFAAMQEKMTADMCRQSIDKLEYRVFDNSELAQQQFAVCKPYKKEFCERVKKVAADMRSPAGFRSTVEKQREWKELLGTCDIAADALLTDVCKKGQDAKDWNFVAEYCPVEAKALAAEHCAGRDYTAQMVGPYGALCSKYAQRPNNAIPTKDDLIKSGVDEGVNKLKKLLPF